MNSGGLIMVLWRRASFRWLFTGMLFSRTGDAIGLVAISWLTLSIAGPAQLGLILFASGVSAAASAPVMGHLIDRVGIRPMLLADNLARAVLISIIPALIWTHALHLSYLYGITILSSLLSSATEIGQEAAIPAIVPDEDLQSANTLASVIWDASAFVGPAVAGAIVQWAGIPVAFLADAATFLIMAVTALALPARAAPDARQENQQGGGDSALGRLLIGFRLLWQLRAVAVMTMIGVCVLAVAGAMEVFLPSYSRETLRVGAAGYGLLASVAGIGSLAGTLWLTRAVRRLRPGVALALVLGLRGLLLVPLALARLLPLACLSAAGSSFADGPFYPISRSITQRAIPADMRGRVLGARATLGAAGFPLGAAAGGAGLGLAGPTAVALILAAVHVPLIAMALGTRDLMKQPEASGGERRVSESLDVC